MFACMHKFTHLHLEKVLGFNKSTVAGGAEVREKKTVGEVKEGRGGVRWCGEDANS